jgi:hypothetical protein
MPEPYALFGGLAGLHEVAETTERSRRGGALLMRGSLAEPTPFDHRS